MVVWTGVSLRLLSKTLQRLVTGFSVIDCINTPSTEKLNLYTTFPLFKIMDLDFVGLKLILDIHLLPTDVVVTVKSSMKALMGGCWILNLDRRPLHSISAAFTNIFMAKVTIPFLSQFDVMLPDVTLSLKSP